MNCLIAFINASTATPLLPLLHIPPLNALNWCIYQNFAGLMQLDIAVISAINVIYELDCQHHHDKRLVAA